MYVHVCVCACVCHVYGLPDICPIRWVHIGCDPDNAIVDIVHHICAVNTSDVVEQKGVELGHPPPKVDGEGWVIVSCHQLRCCDCHLRNCQQKVVTGA